MLGVVVVVVVILRSRETSLDTSATEGLVARGGLVVRNGGGRGSGAAGGRVAGAARSGSAPPSRGRAAGSGPTEVGDDDPRKTMSDVPLNLCHRGCTIEARHSWCCGGRRHHLQRGPCQPLSLS